MGVKQTPLRPDGTVPGWRAARLITMQSNTAASTPRPQPVGGFRELIAWQKAIDLVVATHRVADRLPASQRFALADQLRRAAISVPANLAEGAGRTHLGDYLHHLSIARGSTRELESHLEVVRRLGYEAGDALHAAEQLVQEESRLLHTLIRRLADLRPARR